MASISAITKNAFLVEITALALAQITVWKLNPNAVDANKDLNIIKERSINQVYAKLA